MQPLLSDGNAVAGDLLSFAFESQDLQRIDSWDSGRKRGKEVGDAPHRPPEERHGAKNNSEEKEQWRAGEKESHHLQENLRLPREQTALYITVGQRQDGLQDPEKFMAGMRIRPNTFREYDQQSLGKSELVREPDGTVQKCSQGPVGWVIKADMTGGRVIEKFVTYREQPLPEGVDTVVLPAMEQQKPGK
ncbi:MAG: hypothetical protein FJW37_10135 [Acidobacteria bacterium]|nr:hypothetical protein [Acidobacteriota bacterium]